MQKAYNYFCYPYESCKPQVYLEYNTKKLNLNEAEAKALQQIEYRNKKTEMKNLRQKEFPLSVIIVVKKSRIPMILVAFATDVI